MRDFKVLRQRHITRRFRRIVERQSPEPIGFEVTEFELLLDLDPGAAHRALAG